MQNTGPGAPTGGSGGGGLFSIHQIFGSKTPSATRPSTSGTSATQSTYGSTTSRKATLNPFSSSATGALRRPSTPNFSRARSSSNNFSASPGKRSNSSSVDQSDDNSYPLRVPSRQENQPLKSADNYRQVQATAAAATGIATGHLPSSPTESLSSIAPYSKMLVRPSTATQNMGYNGPMPMSGLTAPNLPPSPTAETITYQHIQETSSKRISTLDYLRKAHEGRVYWFNTLLFNKPDLQRMPYFDTRKLGRRATNYLLLGLSLPTVVDLSASNAIEFLKTLNALLSEFESYQQIHPPDGSSSLSRRGFPQMFKRATVGAGKGRRSSAAADMGFALGLDSSDGKSASDSAFGVGETELLPGEEYTHLLTPSLPFDPDFYETFATLCDVLIDCYTKLMSLVSSPKECSPIVAEMFTKADARVRKIIVQGVVKEFEDSSRTGVKSEVAGVGRVVLGGLM